MEVISKTEPVKHLDPNCFFTAKPEEIIEPYEITELDKVQKIFLLLMTVAAIASLIPATKTVASLVMRCSSLVSASSIAVVDYNKAPEHCTNHLINVAKLVVIGAGIIGVAVGSPTALLCALGIDTIYQISQFVFTATSRNTCECRSIAHGIMVLTDVCFFLAISGCGVGWIVGAGVVSAFAFTVFAVYVAKSMRHGADVIDLSCYCALSLITLVGGIMGTRMSPKDLLTLPLGGNTLGVADEMGDVERPSAQERRRLSTRESRRAEQAHPLNVRVRVISSNSPSSESA